MGGSNRPRRGDITWVAPIRTREAIEGIETSLRYEPRNLALFVLGVNSNLRGSDLRRLTVGDVQGSVPGDLLVIREQKTGKVRRTPLNRKVCKVLDSWLRVHPQADDP